MSAKVIMIDAKCSDMCSTSILDSEGKILAGGSGYVPNFMPGPHYGDYIVLEIDLETGKLLNWTPPTKEQLEDYIASHPPDNTFSVNY